MLQPLLQRKAVRGGQRIRVVSGVVVAAAAARKFAGLAGRTLRHARVPLHLVDDVQVRIVHRRGGARGRAVPIAGPVPGIPSPRYVQVIRDTDGVLRRRASAQAARQLHLLLLLLLHHVLHRASADVLRLRVTVDGVNALQTENLDRQTE